MPLAFRSFFFFLLTKILATLGALTNPNCRPTCAALPPFAPAPQATASGITDLLVLERRQLTRVTLCSFSPASEPPCSFAFSPCPHKLLSFRLPSPILTPCSEHTLTSFSVFRSALRRLPCDPNRRPHCFTQDAHALGHLQEAKPFFRANSPSFHVLARPNVCRPTSRAPSHLHPPIPPPPPLSVLKERRTKTLTTNSSPPHSLQR